MHKFSFFLGVDFKVKFLTAGGKRLKLTIWDTGRNFLKILTLMNPLET